VLELREVRRRFGGIRAVDGVTLAIPEGAVVAVIGPNGAGKSTLFALLMGELALSGGKISLDGRDMRGLSPGRRARVGIGRTFQTPRLFSGLSVEENMRVALLARRGRAGVPRGGRYPDSGDSRARVRGVELASRARASHPEKSSTPPSRAPSRSQTRSPSQASGGSIDQIHGRQDQIHGRQDGAADRAALAEVGLREQAGALAGSLSQGQRKRLELAMVLALEPRILLLDEPTAGMGVGERAAIMELVMAAVERRGLTMVFCEHDMETVFAHARRVVVMDRGVLIADGSPESVRVDPHVQEVYLGRHPGRRA
jgi:branched-chain amino acid transport system ATP-binding protein